VFRRWYLPLAALAALLVIPVVARAEDPAAGSTAAPSLD